MNASPPISGIIVLYDELNLVSSTTLPLNFVPLLFSRNFFITESRKTTDTLNLS